MAVTVDHRERVLAEADDLVVAAMNDHTAPGLAVGVVHDGEVVYAKGFGIAEVDTNRPVTTDTVFRIGSVTKTMTAIAILQLLEQGLLDLDDPVTEHLRAYDFHQPAGTRAATLRDVLTHTSGVGEARRLHDLARPGGVADLGVAAGSPVPTLAEHYGSRGLVADIGPGEKWSYGNHAFATLGQIIHDVTGQPYDEYLRDHVLDPLGMTSSDVVRSDRVRDNLAVGYRMKGDALTAYPDTEIAVPAAGSVFSTLDDMLRYAAALQGRGTNAYGSVLTPETFAQLFEAQWQLHPQIFTMGLSFLMEDRHGHRVASHSGGWPGFVSMLTLAPDDGVAVVAFTNSMTASASVVTDRLLRALLDVPAASLASLVPAGVPEHAELWSELTGVFRPARGVLTNIRPIGAFGNELQVLVHEGHLAVRGLIGLARKPVRLHAIDADDPLLFGLLLESQGECVEGRVQFQRDVDGQVVGLNGLLGAPVILHRVPEWKSFRRAATAAAASAGLAVGGWLLRRRP